MSKREIKKEYKQKKRSLRLDYIKKKRELVREYEGKMDEYYEISGETRPVDPPKRSVLEEVGNAVTHGVGAIFAIVAFVLMLNLSVSPVEYLGAITYFIGLFVMFTMSCLYHSFKHGSAVKRLFRRFDYSCIYLLIGATFAPILLAYVGGIFGGIFFAIQWLVIVFGITFVAVFSPARFRKLHIALYVILGWCGLLILPTMIKNGDYAFLAYILGGGVVYSVGIIPYAMKKGPSHFIWHFFVLLGAVVQWVGVYTCIYLK